MKNYKFRFSVIIPIYNAEKNLEESIKSVIKQNIGFKNNIQLILINDGSTDSSEEICLRYKKMYPNNIKYINQNRLGINAARNQGAKCVEGKYVNFLDSEDKWDIDVFSKVWNFFEKNYQEIDVVACRIKNIEEPNEYNLLDYKFDKDKIVDINTQYECIQENVSSTFVKSEEIKLNKFDEELNYAEDALLLGKIILKKCKYGIMKSAIYNYRKKEDNTSELNNDKGNVQEYKRSIEYYKELIKTSVEKYDLVIPYIQYQIVYDLQWKFKKDSNQENILKEEFEEYKNEIKKILEKVEDVIIIKQQYIFSEHKFLMFKVKYGEEIQDEIIVKKNQIYIKGLHLTNLKNKSMFKIIIMEIKDENLLIEGQVQCLLNKNDYNIYVEIKGEEEYTKKVELIPFELNNKRCIFGQLTNIQRFQVKIPLNSVKRIKFIFKYKDEEPFKLNLNFGKFAKLNNIKESYYKSENYVLRQDNGNILIARRKKELVKKCEREYIKSLLEIKEYKVILYRILYSIYKKIKKKDIWLISDRINRANDNGMHLFKYISKKERDTDVYFFIDKNSEDYNEMKKYGKIIKYGSLKYKIYFLLCSKMISSQADEWVINAFEDKREYLRDLYNFDFVFLQHGITKDDISKWLNKFNKNIKLFETCAKKEYNSILNNPNYIYTENEVKLSGFPRYDNLKDNAKKIILYMPTWRKNIAEELKSKGNYSVRKYSDKFKKTEYFDFYNRLINDQRILDTLKKYGYKAKFCIHPSFEKQYIDFNKNDLLEISPKIADYQKEFSESSLLVTDFSSVAFDFAYLRKPVIYTQFDYDTFYEGHLYKKGYFDYETDGFGPICYNFEDSVNEIIKAIKNDCKLEEKYEKRINEFYVLNDKKNCERVYEDIKNM